MKKALAIGAACALALAIAWPQRFSIQAFVSEHTWGMRAPQRGSGSDQVERMRVEWYDLDSKLLDRELGQVAFLPEGDVEGRPLLVFLHGRGGHPGAYRTESARALAALGDDAPVIVQVAGGDSSYYHDRDDGPWGRYVIEEAIPAAIERFGLDADRVAIGGISMGGFGALDIARSHPEDFCAVGGHSAALWKLGSETPPGAFDDAEDFERHDVIEWAEDGAEGFEDMRVWLDTGEDDVFRGAIEHLADELEQHDVDVTAHTRKGGHDGRYWSRHFGQYVRFYASALKDCE